MNGIGVACGAVEALICRQETGLAAIIRTMQVEDVAVIDLGAITLPVPERLHTGHDLRSWLHRHRRPEPWHGPPRLAPHLGADLRRSQCGGLRCRASEGPRSWLPCCPASSPNRGADAGRYAEKTRQIHTSPVPRMRPLAPEAKKDPAGTACGVSFCCDFTHLRGAEPNRRRRQRMR